MSISSIARADARFQEQIHRQWRDWRAYLRAQLTLLEAQATSAHAAFEQAETREAEIAQARRTLAALPQAQRALFAQVCDERRQRAQSAAEAIHGNRAVLPDADATERQALTDLLAEAEGRAEGIDRQSGWGDVPLLVDGALQWYRVHVPTLQDAPDAAAYAMGADSDDLRRRMILAGALGLSAVLFLAVWFLWPREHRPTLLNHAGPTVNGTPVTPWPVDRIILVAADGHEATVPLGSSLTDDWARFVDGTPTNGFQQTSALAPMVICVPGPALANVALARLPGNNSLPERVYLRISDPAMPADLRIDACDRPTSRLFRLQHTAALPQQPLGEPVALVDGNELTVQALRLVGPVDDAALPPDAAWVDVAIAAPELDWPAYAPTLLLANGTSIQTPELLPHADGVILRYRVPLPAAALDIAWTVTIPDGQRQLRWRATLPPPPDRLTILGAALEIRQVGVTRGDTGDITLQVTLHNRGAHPLALLPDDLRLQRGAELTPLPLASGLDPPLAPGETRTLAIPLPQTATHTTTVLAIGPYRWQITP